MSADVRPYRPCVGIALLNRENRVLVCRRIMDRADTADEESLSLAEPWQMPQGGVDPGEDLVAAARRELHEETSVRSVALLAEAADWFSYDVPAGTAGARFRKWRGQRQKWFAFRFTGPDSEIDVTHPPDGAKPEFDAWRWVAMDELPGLIVPFKREVYERVVQAFRHLAP